MARYPNVVKRAQAELDTVVENKLPTLEDRAQLPYIEAIVSETMRWGSVVPMGMYIPF